MSLSINSSDPSRATPSNDDDKAKRADAQAHTPKDFDFSGPSYSTVNLPTLAARPTKAALAHDAADVVAKAKKVAEDLKSPELRHLLEAGGSLGIHAVEVLKDTVDIAKSAPAAVEGSPVDIVEAAKAALDLAKDSYELYNDAKDFKAANTPEARAKLTEFLSDLKAMEQAGAKFGTTARKFVAGF